jgi:predicted acyl esterase
MLAVSGELRLDSLEAWLVSFPGKECQTITGIVADTEACCRIPSSDFGGTDRYVPAFWQGQSLNKDQVVTNQYGRPGRAARQWGPDTIEGDLPDDTLKANCRDQVIDNTNNHFRDDEYYSSKEYDLGAIQVPLLSVGNWGGILLHLRGNVHGFLGAGSRRKYLRFITGRHDLPFYQEENVALQKGFLDAFLKGEDADGWTTGEAPKVGITLREGDVGVDDNIAERGYKHRFEDAWPIARTQYTKYYLDPSLGLSTTAIDVSSHCKVSYNAPGSLAEPHSIRFTTEAFQSSAEFTGHIVAHLNVSATASDDGRTPPTELDIFITIRHLDANSKEILYTGTVGDPVPVTKGWLRTSLRKTNASDARHMPWSPHREYLSTDVQPVKEGEVYAVDVEIWPTNVVVSPGHRLVFEISSGDTQGAGLFEHNSEVDRPRDRLSGYNHVHFGPQHDNWLLMPKIPSPI